MNVSLWLTVHNQFYTHLHVGHYVHATFSVEKNVTLPSLAKVPHHAYARVTHFATVVFTENGGNAIMHIFDNIS